MNKAITGKFNIRDFYQLRPRQSAALMRYIKTLPVELDSCKNYFSHAEEFKITKPQFRHVPNAGRSIHAGLRLVFQLTLDDYLR